jgi:hypothetical protein
LPRGINENRSMVDLKDCQVGSEESSDFQVGNEMGSLEDLIDCQEGREEIPDFQVGKGEKMNSELRVHISKER